MRIPRLQSQSRSTDSAKKSETLPESRAERHPVRLDAFARLRPHTVVPITIVNLSYGGCRIEIASTLQVGDQIHITVKGSIIAATVGWVSDGSAGLSFNRDPAGSKPKLKHHDCTDAPVATAIQATMQRYGRPKYTVWISDLSAEGCKAEYADRPNIDDRVHLKFQGLETIEGAVRWVEGNHAGVIFDRPIHPAVFQALVDPSAPR